MKTQRLLIAFIAVVVSMALSSECCAKIPHTQGDFVFATTTLATGDKDVSTVLSSVNKYPSLFVSGESNSTSSDVTVTVSVDAYNSDSQRYSATKTIVIHPNNSGYETIPLQFTQNFGTSANWSVTYTVKYAPANTVITMEAYGTTGL
jgi:hypothetical protein